MLRVEEARKGLDGGDPCVYDDQYDDSWLLPWPLYRIGVQGDPGRNQRNGHFVPVHCWGVGKRWAALNGWVVKMDVENVEEPVQLVARVPERVLSSWWHSSSLVSMDHSSDRNELVMVWLGPRESTGADGHEVWCRVMAMQPGIDETERTRWSRLITFRVPEEQLLEQQQKPGERQIEVRVLNDGSVVVCIAIGWTMMIERLERDANGTVVNKRCWRYRTVESWDATAPTLTDFIQWRLYRAPLMVVALQSSNDGYANVVVVHGRTVVVPGIGRWELILDDNIRFLFRAEIGAQGRALFLIVMTGQRVAMVHCTVPNGTESGCLERLPRVSFVPFAFRGTPISSTSNSGDDGIMCTLDGLHVHIYAIQDLRRARTLELRFLCSLTTHGSTETLHCSERDPVERVHAYQGDGFLLISSEHTDLVYLIGTRTTRANGFIFKQTSP